VIVYWRKWMHIFPTIQALAAASVEDVNAVWAGLGYYRRAQLLRSGAQMVMTEFGGVVPSSVTDLLRIPGVGPYTAGAIASIAFDQSAPLVDGNVMRVFSRLRAMQSEIGGTGGGLEKQCWALARVLVTETEREPGVLNQALMELGATVCKPTSPSCDLCPVSHTCQARQLVLHSESRRTEEERKGLPASVTEFPKKIAKKRAKEVVLSVCVLGTDTSFSPLDSSSSSGTSDDKESVRRYLFVRRPETGLLAGQWEFPSVVMWDESSPDTSPSTAPGSNSSSTTTKRARNAEERDDDDKDTEKSSVATLPVFSSEELWRPLETYLSHTLSVSVIPSSDTPSPPHPSRAVPTDTVKGTTATRGRRECARKDAKRVGKRLVKESDKRSDVSESLAPPVMSSLSPQCSVRVMLSSSSSSSSSSV